MECQIHNVVGSNSGEASCPVCGVPGLCEGILADEDKADDIQHCEVHLCTHRNCMEANEMMIESSLSKKIANVAIQHHNKNVIFITEYVRRFLFVHLLLFQPGRRALLGVSDLPVL